MAVVYKEKVTKEKVFQCDKCKMTKPMSLAQALSERAYDDKWLYFEDDRVLCPKCLSVIIDNWYNQQETNFQLQGSAPEKTRKKVLA